MKLSFSPLVLAMVAFAQQQPQQAPPGVEDELRARVTAFYQNFVDGSPRKAEVFVAEDTKDYYYNAQKLHFESFKVGKVTFSDNFTKAIVMVVGKTEKVLAGQKVQMEVPQETHWKIENGQWCWTYHPEDYAITPMGGKNPPPGSGAGVPPPKDLTPEAIRKAGEAILKEQPMGLDTGAITIRTDRVSDAQIVFTNGGMGYTQIEVNGPIVRGLTFKFDNPMVPPKGKAVLKIHYDPSDKSGPSDAWIPKGTIPFQLSVSPFGRTFSLDVTFINGN
ncbi:MAG TPA: hypothetical protein VMT15_15385 [Bryobacteraceae bacterium]|nr:hypothetical protein [Bryobacteraceae bacterium]